MPDARPDDDAFAAFTWRALALRLAIVAIPFWLTVPVLISNVDGPIKIVFAIVLGVTLASPRAGLLLVATFAPLGELIGQMIGARTFRISEAIVLTFLVGWLLRALRDRRGPRVTAAAAGWLFAATIVASIAGLAWQLGRYPGELPYTVDQIGHLYFFIADRIGFVEGARLLEGLGLVTATVMLFRRDPALSRSLPLALASSAAAAALSSVLLWRGIGSAETLARFRLIGYRVSGHIADVNAAGSYFAMVLCLGLGMAARERGHRRATWLCLTAASGVGLWFSESRSAVAAAGVMIIVAVMWTATGRLSVRVRAVTLAAVIVALMAGAGIRVRMLENDPSYRGSGFREQFVQTSARMIAVRPLFGVGEGQYNPSSPLFLSPQLAFTYGAENAHNFFLQVGGELGLVGLGLFIAFVGAAVARSARAIARIPTDARLLGVTGSVVGFLLTCLTGHPFLVAEVAFPFWMLFGLMTALAGSALLNQATAAGVARPGSRAPRAVRWLTAATALAILILGSLSTATMALSPAESQAVDGFYGWEAMADGTRFRWSGRYASVFVPADVTRVEIPVRLPTDGRSIRAMGVEVMTGGVDRGRTLVDGTWAIISLSLAPVPPPARFKRIDLGVDRVWQPALYIAGSADMRQVGIQVGEPRLFRE